MPAIDATRTADTVSAGIPPELFGPLQEFFACAIIGFPIATTYVFSQLRLPDDADADVKSQDIWHYDTANVLVLSPVPKGQRCAEVSGEAHLSMIVDIPGADWLHLPRSVVYGTYRPCVVAKASLLTQICVRAMDTLTIALISHAIYNMFVLNLAHLADDVELPW